MIGQFTDLDNFGTALLGQREYGFLTLQSSCNSSLQVLLEVRARPLPAFSPVIEEKRLPLQEIVSAGLVHLSVTSCCKRCVRSCNRRAQLRQAYLHSIKL